MSTTSAARKGMNEVRCSGKDFHHSGFQNRRRPFAEAAPARWSSTVLPAKLSFRRSIAAGATGRVLLCRGRGIPAAERRNDHARSASGQPTPHGIHAGPAQHGRDAPHRFPIGSEWAPPLQRRPFGDSHHAVLIRLQSLKPWGTSGRRRKTSCTTLVRRVFETIPGEPGWRSVKVQNGTPIPAQRLPGAKGGWSGKNVFLGIGRIGGENTGVLGGGLGLA